MIKNMLGIGFIYDNITICVLENSTSCDNCWRVSSAHYFADCVHCVTIIRSCC